MTAASTRLAHPGDAASHLVGGFPESGRADFPTGDPVWLVPDRVELEGDYLWWRDTGVRTVKRSPELWAQFLMLESAPPERILQYARRWGVLRLCESDALPHVHPPVAKTAALKEADFLEIRFMGPIQMRELVPDPKAPDQVSLPEWCSIGPTQRGDAGDVRMRSFFPTFEQACPIRTHNNGYAESIAAWRAWVRRVIALLHVTDSLHRQRMAPMEQWQAACDWDGMRFDGDPQLWTPPRGVREGRAQVEQVVNHWLLLGRTRAKFEFERSGATIQFTGAGLFGALALQVALAVAQRDGFAICSGHAGPYIPAKRRPKTGQRRYCPECRRKGLPLVDAKRDQRARQRKRSRRPR
jgi:hypothetical protein